MANSWCAVTNTTEGTVFPSRVQAVKKLDARDFRHVYVEEQNVVGILVQFVDGVVNNFVASLQWYKAPFTRVNPTAEFNALPANVGAIAFGDDSLFPLNNDGTAFPQRPDVTQYGVVGDFSRTWGKHT
jgi:hypothetical protein